MQVFEDKKSFWRNCLTKLKGKIKKNDFIGFDIETFGDENKFYSGSFYYYKKGVPMYKYFKCKNEMLKFILRREFRNKYVVATNLGFDLTGLFWDTPYWNNIAGNLITRGSDILMASYDLGNNNGKIKFIDTMNYVGFSVEKLGKIIGVPKLPKPDCLGRLPNNKWEEFDLMQYNIQDSRISCDFMYFLQEGINKAGGNLKITIASTSMDVWRRGHLKDFIIKEEYLLKDSSIKDLIFNGYYGGRTEIFKRGVFKDVNYYDINSLYPSVMLKKFPNPNSVKKIFNPNISYILNYEGVTECMVECPYMHKPLLPLRVDGKLIFPIGNFKGTYNNVELRKALQLGYKITPLKQIVYTEMFYPFKTYVEHFYNQRLLYKSQGSNMELIMKLLLNSLYGKFAQRNRQKVVIKKLHDMSDEEYLSYLKLDNPSFDVKNGVLIDIEKSEFNGIFSLPIFSSYVTSYARLVMYDYINKYDTIYMDTDSIFIKEKLNNCSNKLGDMKLECNVSEGVFIKPKMYKIDDEIKIKGVTRCSDEEFKDLLMGIGVSKVKFSKLRESIRRGINPNTKIEVTKNVCLNDTKRKWDKDFNIFNNDDSDPLEVDYFNGENHVINNFDLPIDNDKFLDEEVNAFINNNLHYKKHFKGRLMDFKVLLKSLLGKGFNLVNFDFLSLSNDKPLSEYEDDLIHGGI